MPEPITKSIVVAADPATAFRTWIEEIDGWWPKSHSRSKDAATRIAGIDAWTQRKDGYHRAWIDVLACYERASAKGATP